MPRNRGRLRFSRRFVLQVRRAVDPPSLSLRRASDVLIDKNRVTVRIDQHQAGRADTGLISLGSELVMAQRPFPGNVSIGAMVNIRRIVKTLLLSLGAIVALLVLLLGGLWAYAAIDKEDTFVLQNSEFEDANYLRKIEPSKEDDRLIHHRDYVPVYAHRLKRGSGTIFAYRFYSNGDVLTIDDEEYRKVTVWIAGDLPTSTINLPLGDVSKCLLVFSHGGSAWPQSGCSGYGTSGSVRVEPLGRHLKITIHGEVTPVGNAHDRCRIEKIDLTFQAKEIAFKDLTPWLGIAGRYPYDETYRAR
jgi:hypothetical protein